MPTKKQKDLEMTVIGQITSDADDAKLALESGVQDGMFVHKFKNDDQSMTQALFKAAKDHFTQHDRLLTPQALEIYAKRQGLGMGTGQPGQRLVSLLVKCQAMPMNSDSFPALLDELREREMQENLTEFGQDIREIIKTRGLTEAHEYIHEWTRQNPIQNGSPEPTITAMSATELQAADIEPKPPLVCNGRGQVLMLRQKTLIHGDLRSNKTTLCIDMGISMATGKSFLGRFIVRNSSVLYIAAEGTATDYQTTVNMICNHRGIMPDELGDSLQFVIMAEQEQDVRLSLDDPKSVDRWISWIDGMDEPPGVIIFDPLLRLHAGDENDSKSAQQIMTQLDRFEREFGSDIILVHHNNKSAGKNGYHRARGSTHFANSCGVVSIGKKSMDPMDCHYEISAIPKSGQPVPQFEMMWEFAPDEILGINIRGAGSAQELHPNKLTILDAITTLIEHGEPPTHSRITQCLDASLTRRTVARHASTLVALGYLSAEEIDSRGTLAYEPTGKMPRDADDDWEECYP